MPNAILHVVAPNGAYQGYKFSADEIVRIGNDPAEDDIGLTGPGIVLNHLLISNEQIIALSPLGTPTLDGRFLVPNRPFPLTNGAVIRVAKYELRYFTGDEDVKPFGSYELEGAIAQTAQLQDSEDSFDPNKQYIRTEVIGIAETGLRVKPGEAISFQLQIKNEGHRFATFDVDLKGLPPKWCHLSRQIDIHPNQRALGLVPIVIEPPKDPTSLAGQYHFTIRVTSPRHYPDQADERQISLFIEPYYHYVQNDLQKKRQVMAWWHRYATATFELANRGNNWASYSLSGEDHQNICTFAFVAGEQQTPISWKTPLKLYALADEEKIGPPETIIKARITPQGRPIFLRRRNHPFNITVSPLQGEQESALLAGHVVQRPIIGPWTLALFIIAGLLACGLWILHPSRYINHFRVNNQVHGITAHSGDELTVEWSISRFVTSARIKPGGDLIVGQPVGSMVVTPEKGTSAYVLEVDGPWPAIFPGLRATRVVPVRIDPLIPRVAAEISEAEIASGSEAILRPNIEGAEQAYISKNGTVMPLPTELYQGEMVLMPEEDTDYIISAGSADQVATRELSIAVIEPTATATPTPQVGEFEFSSNQVSAGEPIVVSWDVASGGDTVVLDPLGAMPAQGTLSLTPQESTLYTLMTVNPEGEATILAKQQVTVDQPTPTPTATPAPLAPNIIEFIPSSNRVALGADDDDDSNNGDSNIITLFWTIEGETTDISLLNSDGTLLQNRLPPVGQYHIIVHETDTAFILLAENGPEKVQQSVFLDVIQAPLIYSFKADLFKANNSTTTSDASCLTNQDHQSDFKDCRVLSDTNRIELSWQVANATHVELQQIDRNNITTVSLVGTEDSFIISESPPSDKFRLFIRNGFVENSRGIKFSTPTPE